MCTLITASAKFEFTASQGALKFRKPYKENQFSSSYSETIGPILRIPLANLHEKLDANEMLKKSVL